MEFELCMVCGSLALILQSYKNQAYFHHLIFELRPVGGRLRVQSHFGHGVPNFGHGVPKTAILQ